eukprot:TRINITY_DN1561_c0_g1_i1.p1 TRINITY_DN1561_c0_g1~~TRINITY_DN1561_c0_g1_i1.p1  ORF type:complete len:469 (-),score=82.70 TRINITY_DN1561_c0_g1_i1:138-1544(-)
MACMHTLSVIGEFHICDRVVPGAAAKSKPRIEDDFNFDNLDSKTVPLLAADEERSLPEIPSGPLLGSAELRRQLYFAHFCFFMIGMGLSMTWGSISFPVPVWVWRYPNQNIWPILIAAYNAPGMIVVVAQMIFDHLRSKNKSWPMSHRKYTIALFIALGTPLLITAVQPALILHPNSSGNMIFVTAIIGLCIGATYVWVFQVAGFFPSRCTASLVGGVGFAPLLLLALQFGNSYTGTALSPPASHPTLVYFEMSAVLSGVGLVFFAILMSLRVTRARMDFLRRDRSGKKVGDDGIAGGSGGSLGVKQILKLIWPAGLTLLVVNMTFVAVSALVTNIPSSQNNPNFSTILLYVSAIATFIGAELSVFLLLFSTPMRVFAASMGRLGLFVFLMVYSLAKFWINDYFTYVLIALLALLGGFINSRAYSVAGQVSGIPASDFPRVYTILNLLVYSGVYVGIAFSFIVQYSTK